MKTFIATIIRDGEIVDSFDGTMVHEAAAQAVEEVVKQGWSEHIWIVVHDEDSDEVVWKFDMQKV
jgi:hypothetical protein